jgi:transcriptional regulator with XRE-family HTH domain
MSDMGKRPDPPEATRLRALIGSRLLKYREAHGRTQQAFAQLLGLEHARYAKYEQGRYEMSYWVMMRLREVTNLPLDFWILGKRTEG